MDCVECDPLTSGSSVHQVLAEGGEGGRAGAEHAVAVQRPAHHLQEGEDAALHAGRMSTLVDQACCCSVAPPCGTLPDFFVSSRELNNMVL